LREAGREQRLADATDRSRAQHRGHAFENGLDGNAAARRYLSKRIALKSREPVFGDCENLRIDRIANRRRNRFRLFS